VDTIVQVIDSTEKDGPDRTVTLQRRYLQLEGLQALGDNQPARLSAVMS
jgi:hypothetical protein